MNIWLKSVLVGLVTSVLAFFIYQKIAPQKTKHLFSIHYIVEVNPDKKISGDSKKDVINNVPYIIKRRAEAAGYKVMIKITGERMLDINFQHVDDTLLSRQIITKNNKLEFREIYTLNEIPLLLTKGDEIARKYLPPQPVKSPVSKKSDDTTISPEVRELLRNMEKRKQEAEMTASGLGSLISFRNSIEQISSNTYSSSDIGLINEKDTALLNKILGSPELLQALPYDIKFYYGPADGLSKKEAADQLYLYAIRTGGYEASELQNKDIESAYLDYDSSGRPEIRFRFNSTGARKWEKMTRSNTDRYIAIIIDHLVISAPRVSEPITDGISLISGDFTVKESSTIAAQLNSEIIPAELTIIKEEASPVSSKNTAKLLLTILAVFVVTAGIAYLIFNILKNKQNQ